MADGLTLALFGEPGKGKSSTGNKILGKVVFATSDHEDLATVLCDAETCERNNTGIMVIDTPGFVNNIDDSDDFEMALSITAQAMSRSPNGFSALIFVKKYGDRWTKLEAQCIDFLKKIFGRNCLRDFGVVVYTYADQFYRKYRNTKTFAEWIEENSRSSPSNLITECNNRYVLFDNDLEGPSTCVTELLDVIHRTIRGRLLNEHFQEAKTFGEHLQRQYPSADLNIQRGVKQFLSLLNEPYITFESLRNAAENLENSARNVANSEMLQRIALDIKRKIQAYSETQESVSLELKQLLKEEFKRIPIVPSLIKLTEFIKYLVALFLRFLRSRFIVQQQMTTQ